MQGCRCRCWAQAPRPWLLCRLPLTPLTPRAPSRLTAFDHSPYYGGAQGFETVLDLLDDACTGLLAKIVADQKAQ
jgi:hypothetical protein